MGLDLGEGYIVRQRQPIPRDQPAMLAASASAGYVHTSKAHATKI